QGSRKEADVSSPITFSGFNNIDFGTIVNSLMQAASQPLVDLQTHQNNLQTRSSTFGTLASRTSSIQTAAAALANPSTPLVSASTNDSTALDATADNTATAGAWNVDVLDIARTQVTASSTAPDTNATIVAKSGSLKFSDTLSDTLSGPVTLQGLVDAINNQDGITVHASIVQTAPSKYALVMAANNSGTAGAFTVENHLVDGDDAAIHFDGTNATNATDADIKINGVEVKRSTNTISDAMTGVTLTVQKKTAADQPVLLTVSPDGSALQSKINSFISSYNSFVSFVNTQDSNDESTIGRDPLTRSLRQTLRGALISSYGGSTDDYQFLGQIGIEFNRDGTMQFNATTFDEAMKSNPEGVMTLVAGDGTTGAFAALSTTLAEYTDTNGLITSAQQQITASVGRINQQIDDMT